MIELQARCPAKINLFLHMVGRRPDGYHLLESIFSPVGFDGGLYDDLHLSLSPRQDGRLVFHRTGPLVAIAEEKDLTVKACKAFFGLQHSSGWDIGLQVYKRIPEQAGLGGGSSNAAQVLRLLNAQFPTFASRPRLVELALRLGADVPFFMQDDSAFVEGIGEQITPIQGIQASLLIYKPEENCPTGEIFASDQLTRDSSPVKIAVFASGGFASSEEFETERSQTQEWQVINNALMWRFLKNHTQNSMQTVVEQMLPSWQARFKEFCSWIQPFNPVFVRMSGSGSSWFAVFESEIQSEQAYAVLLQAGLDQHGLLFKSRIG
jgi:4-diphosphocytidyl-2-C-methyl-D-erythritol kinase